MYFQITRSAHDALQCGNYHIGVFGSEGYSVDRAEYYFRKAVTIDPHGPDAWHQYARVAFLKGDFSEALFRINKQFEERGDELMASYYIRGLIAGYAKDYPAAEKDFERFIAWDPGNWAAHNDLAWVYFAQGKFEESKREAAIGLATNPNNPWLHVTHAMSRFNLGEKEGVEEELLKARSLADGLTAAGWGRAYPGNDPAVAESGLASFRAAIQANIDLVHKAANSR